MTVLYADFYSLNQFSSYLILVIAFAWLTAYSKNLCFFQLKPMLRIFKAYASFIRGLCLSVKLKPMLLLSGA
jgi:hypothetical protein